MFSLFNVVTYDGCDAYVLKFIAETDNAECRRDQITDVGKKHIDEYCAQANMEVLKYDFLYTLTFENIVAFEEHGDSEQKAAVYRFKHIYFGYDYDKEDD